MKKEAGRVCQEIQLTLSRAAAGKLQKENSFKDKVTLHVADDKKQ
jgi:hypothetical protein